MEIYVLWLNHTLLVFSWHMIQFLQLELALLLIFQSSWYFETRHKTLLFPTFLKKKLIGSVILFYHALSFIHSDFFKSNYVNKYLRKWRLQSKTESLTNLSNAWHWRLAIQSPCKHIYRTSLHRREEEANQQYLSIQMDL